MQSPLGSQMVQPHQCQFRRTYDCICHRRRHFLLGLFLHHILAQKVWTHAWLHCDFACLLYIKLINGLPAARVTNIVSSTVNIEMEFVVDALPVELIGMNSSMMCDYIKFCADRLLIALGYQRHYKTGNPCEWMEMISLQ
jgi:hypothetical protein